MKQMIIKYLLALIFVFNGKLSAQDNDTLSMQLPPLPSVIAGGNISSIEIVNPNGNSTLIGIIPSKTYNVRNNIVVPQGLQNWLQAYVNQQYASAFSTTGKKKQWRINTLSIGIDSSDAGLVSFVKLSADIVTLSRDASTPMEVVGFDTLIISNKNNVPNLAKDVATSINALYIKTNNTGIGKTGAVSNIAWQQQTVSSYRNTWQILSDSIYPTGVYASFQEFKNNAPSVNNFLASVDSNTKRVVLYTMASDSSLQPVKNAWGIAVNNELYKYENGQLYAIELNETKNGFSISKYKDYRTRRNQAIFWRKNIGERQGDNNPYNDAHVYRTKAGAVKIETTRLDPNSGDLSF